MSNLTESNTMDMSNIHKPSIFDFSIKCGEIGDKLLTENINNSNQLDDNIKQIIDNWINNYQTFNTIYSLMEEKYLKSSELYDILSVSVSFTENLLKLTDIFSKFEQNNHKIHLFIILFKNLQTFIKFGEDDKELIEWSKKYFLNLFNKLNFTKEQKEEILSTGFTLFKDTCVNLNKYYNELGSHWPIYKQKIDEFTNDIRSSIVSDFAKKTMEQFLQTGAESVNVLEKLSE